MGSARPTAEGSDQTILPSDYDCRGSSQVSSLSAGFSWDNSSTAEANRAEGALSKLAAALPPMALDAESPIKYRVVVGVALGEPTTRVIMMDPDEADIRATGRSPIPTNLNADLVKRAAKRMRKPAPVIPATEPESRGATMGETTETIFRGPRRATGATREIALTNEYKPEKNHSWLDVTQ